jgi:hypothetical protein
LLLLKAKANFLASSAYYLRPRSANYADISIVNQLGVEVAHLFSGELDAGEHSFTWSTPPGLSDGVYDCVVRMNGEVQRVGIMLVR